MPAYIVSSTAPVTKGSLLEMTSHTLVLLVRPPDAPDLDEDRLRELQQQHLEHLARMSQQGHMLVAGPLSDQPDQTLRGLCIYRVGLKEARRLAEMDPSVRAGRLAVQAMTWWTAKGSLAFPAEQESGLGPSNQGA